jgi:hypothetical protein
MGILADFHSVGNLERVIQGREYQMLESQDSGLDI